VKHPSPIELSRALASGVDARLRAHLDICDECNEFLATHASIADDVRQLPVVDPDEDRARLLRASLFVAARTPSPAPRRGFVFGFALAGGLAAAAVAAFVLLRAPIEAPHVATIRPHEGAEVVHIDKPDEIVRLSSGTVTVHVAALDTNERFRVVVGDAEIESRGAAFDVRAKHDRLESVRVYDGRVEIRAEGTPPRTLVAGERWEIELARANAEGEAHGDADRVAHGEADRVAIDDADRSADPQANDNAIVEPATVTPAVTEPTTVKRTVAEPSIAESSTHATPTKPGIVESPARATPTKPGIVESPARATPTKPGIVESPRSRAKIRATDKPSIAPARAKRPIEVLFDEGFATLTSGDPAAAAIIFERAARSAPTDPLAEDASFWRASALVRAKSASAASALESFLARYASSPRVGEASAMLGWIVMDRDLDRAEKLFAAAKSDRVASVRASAIKGLAAVAARRAK
jgi:TolA-binding protein